MNMFKAFEERIAKAFGESSLGIVAPFSFKKLAKQALRELERETYVVDGVNTAPALMTILVSQDDEAIMRPVYGELAKEIADLMEAEAARKDYVFVGKPLARFMVEPSLRHGRFAAFANNVDAITLEKLRDEERAFLSGSSAFEEDAVIVPIEEQVAQPHEEPLVVEHVVSDDSSAGLDVLPAGYVDEPLDLGPIGAPAPLVDESPSLVESLPEIPEPVEPEAVPAPESEAEQGEMAIPSEVPVDDLATKDDAEVIANAADDAVIPDGSDEKEGDEEEQEEPATCLFIDRQSGRTYIGTAPSTIIGRERTPSGIVLRDPNVSRRHAKLFYRNGVWSIIDLESTNGTLVNDVDVDTCVLHNGDLLTLGLTNLEFRES